MKDEHKTKQQLIKELAEMRWRIAELEASEAGQTRVEEIQLLADVVRNMQVGLHLYHLEDIDDDRTLRMVATNPAASQFTGVAMEDILGKTLDENFPGLRDKGISQLYAEVVRSGKSVELEEVYYGDDRVMYGAFSVKAFPLPNNHVGVTFENITGRKRMEEALRESEEKYHSLYSSMTEGVALHEIVYNDLGEAVDYTLLDVNPSYESIVGLKGEEVIGRTASELYGTGKPPYLEIYATVAASGEPTSFETYFPPMEKHFSISVFSPGKGKFATVFEDITERKRVEEALRESEERYRAVSDLTSDYADALRVEPDGTLTREWVTGAFTRITGFTPDEVSARDAWKSIVHPDDFPIFLRRLDTLLSGQPDVSEYRIITKQGEVRWLRAHGRPVWDEAQGRVVRYIGAAQDITERKRTEEAIEQLRRRNELILNAAGEGIFGLDLQGKHTFVNPAAASMLGYKVEELIAQSGHETWHHSKPDGSPYPEDECPICKAYQAGIIQRGDDELFWRKDGSSFPVEYVSTPIQEDGEVVGAVVVFKDITDRKQVEEKMRRRNRELTLLNQVIAASAAGLEPEAVLETACRELARTFDVPRTLATLLNEQKTEAVVATEYLAEGRPALLGETIPVADNALFQYLLSRKTPLVVDDAPSDPRLASSPSTPEDEVKGQPGAISLLVLPLVIKEEVIGSLALESFEPRPFSAEEVNLAWRVADQVAGALARTRLTQIHQRLITAIGQATESVVITDTGGTILYVNPAFEQVSGYSQAEAIGQNPRILRSGKQSPAFYEELWKTLTAGEVWHGRFVNKRKDGTYYTEDATISPVRDESGVIVNYVAVKRDVTHELQLEEQYRQAHKMEAVGRLAGGVAHDFNNLLTAIIGYSALTLRALPPDHSVRSDIEDIRKNAERAASLTRQLLTFARRQVVEPRVLSLNELILNVDKMLRRLISEDIELVTLLAPDLGWLKADPGQLEQVLLNLAVNAHDAMPDGGKLIIKTANVTLGQDETNRYPELTPGEYIMLTVSDTGLGMTEEVKAHIFEPFFTTKGIGKGTGLGLATCFGIIKQSGGHVWVDSEVGQGTTFIIYLPRIKEAVGVGFRQQRTDDLPRGMETVLLVEDEPSVRELAARMLHDQGYNVLQAINGDEALRVVQEHPGEEIHLLATDVVMPQMGGPELADRLKVVHPNVKILFISGYTDRTIAHDGVLESDTAFLQKPFSPEALARKVREVLDRP